MSDSKRKRWGWMIGLALVLPGSRSQTATPIVLTSGLKITGNTTVKPGDYVLRGTTAGCVRISGSDFTVDFHGARILGSRKGAAPGIRIADARNVTIKDADVSGCLWGVVVERSRDIRFLNCVSSHNADLPPGTVIDESGREPEDNHGGGFVVRDSRDCLFQHCRAQRQWDGIDVVRSEGIVIEDGDFSYNGNWGVHLWGSSRNVFRRNRAVWCTTGEGALYQALTGWQTYDAQAVGIDHNSNENLIEANDLRFGGDGIFIRANEGPITPGTVVPPRNGSHRNVLRGNDCSFSPNNAIEVDLVDDTVIENNNCSFSHYGMWLGYSRRCLIRGNTCINDTAHAVEIENGQRDRFENNVFGFDTPRTDAALVYLRQNHRDATPSAGYVFTGNLYYGARQGVLLRDTTATFDGDTICTEGVAPATLVATVGSSRGNEMRTRQQSGESGSSPILKPEKEPIRPGTLDHLAGNGLGNGGPPPVLEMEGIPVWVQSFDTHEIRFSMPDDLWDRPAKTVVSLRVFNGRNWSPAVKRKIMWAADRIRIEKVARISDSLVLTGDNLTGNVRINNIPVRCTKVTPSEIIAEIPAGISGAVLYNIMVERSHGKILERSWPIAITADPHRSSQHLQKP